MVFGAVFGVVFGTMFGGACHMVAECWRPAVGTSETASRKGHRSAMSRRQGKASQRLRPCVCVSCCSFTLCSVCVVFFSYNSGASTARASELHHELHVCVSPALPLRRRRSRRKRRRVGAAGANQPERVKRESTLDISALSPECAVRASGGEFTCIKSTSQYCISWFLAPK